MVSIAGLIPFTTIDFPGRLAAVLFLQGCPFRCPFCHNPELQKAGEALNPLPWSEAVCFLQKRQGILDGVVLSGGEPLMSPDVIDLARQIKGMGFAVGIHTCGYYPDRLRQILPWTDWVGLDIKGPAHKYDEMSGCKNVASRVWESLDILLQSGILFEARTTCDPRHLTIADIDEVAQDLSDRGVKTYVLQQYRTFDADINPPDMSDILSFFRNEALQRRLKNIFLTYYVR